MAEQEQEILLRGPIEFPVKPWRAERLATNQAEYGQLRITKSFLEHQLSSINERMAELRLLIMDDLLEHSRAQIAVVSEDPGGLGYGRTHTALDAPPRPSVIGNLAHTIKGRLGML